MSGNVWWDAGETTYRKANILDEVFFQVRIFLFDIVDRVLIDVTS